MTNADEQILKDLFTWDNRNIELRIKFNDSEELEMTVSGWAQDIDEGAHVHGTIIRPVKSSRNWSEGTAIMFQLRDVERVEDMRTGQNILSHK